MHRTTPQAVGFQDSVLAWSERCGRRDLPWQNPRTPYRVWVSEIMLQQTRVATVVPYFLRFTEQFPDLGALARADLERVLGLWSGLGYYRRARNLHQTARIVSECFHGNLPTDLEQLAALPGIGRSTAGAILSLGYGIAAPILDGNVKRVLSRFWGIEGWPGDSRIEKELWRLSEWLTPAARCAQYNQALMDLGALICLPKSPRCECCPLADSCLARAQNRGMELPTPRPNQPLPVRSAFFLLLVETTGRVYLEKRPPTGVWADLWCFPEFASLEDLRHWCERRGLIDFRLERLPERRHTFSHFHLDYTPVVVRDVRHWVRVEEKARTAWLLPQGDPEIGVPTPVRRLLAEISDGS
ncbi:MAG TPA: A/G-specific adenine glycosylase [Methylococcus sp.]|nr:A/G-specific adenine glycosylase [Methylococcus sp.]